MARGGWCSATDGFMSMIDDWREVLQGWANRMPRLVQQPWMARLPWAARTEEDPSRHGQQPLVPAASIAGRALVTVIAIMTFLAGLTAGVFPEPDRFAGLDARRKGDGRAGQHDHGRSHVEAGEFFAAPERAPDT